MSTRYSMVQECTDLYEATDVANGDLEIIIRIPRRFKNLWLSKLSELTTDDAEIEQWEDFEEDTDNRASSC